MIHKRNVSFCVLYSGHLGYWIDGESHEKNANQIQTAFRIGDYSEEMGVSGPLSKG